MATTARNFFSDKEKDEIIRAIANAELQSSGEIRVHIDLDCKGELMDRAATIFQKTGMSKTTERNGVLFYIAIKSRKFAILGDAGINKMVSPHFWEDLKARMLISFAQNNYAQGLSQAIAEAGHELRKHFPRNSLDVNELPNEISFEE